MSIDRRRAARAIAEFLAALGYDTSSNAELKETPERVVEAYESDLVCGFGVDVLELVKGGSVLAGSQDSKGVVVVEDIEVTTMCPHHLMPAQGKALVAYVPGERVLGLGRVAKLVNACARQLILQEQIGHDVVDALMRGAGAEGALCRLSLVHTCLTARGPRQASSVVHTVASAGSLAEPGGYEQVAFATGRGACP